MPKQTEITVYGINVVLQCDTRIEAQMYGEDMNIQEIAEYIKARFPEGTEPSQNPRAAENTQMRLYLTGSVSSNIRLSY
ncbi:hypothetical protein D3C87_2069000 [compost metagenome]